MRTTVILDDPLFAEAKRRAAETGQTLSELIGGALRDALRARPAPKELPFRMPTFGGRAVLRHEPADFAAVLEEEDRPRGRR